jgi:molybdopterin synthase catalytic subunit
MEFKGIARSTINSRNVQSLGFSGASEMIQQCINQIDAYLISQ